MFNIPACTPAMVRQSHPARHLPPGAFRIPKRILVLAVGLWASAVWAHLGGTTETLESEKATLRISAQRVEHRTLYDIHHLQREDGEIRQFSDHAGNIFAVSWQTRLPVPLADVLEAPSVTPTTAAGAGAGLPKAAGAYALRHSASAVSGDRVVHVLKLAHLFMGSAQLSSKIPVGVDAKELR